jgi:tetratricopeptide (TPR) repeat protein
MRQRLSFVLGAFGAALILLAFTQGKISKTPLNAKKAAIGCSPDWESLEKMMEEIEIPLVPGAGRYQWKITTKNDSAQIYFNQGINMYYAFHIIEAMASFKKAAKFDPDCAMLYWAQALSYGPNINDIGYAASPEALMSSGRAMELASKASEKEKMLIKAQAQRYSPDSTRTRESLNQDYVDAMRKAFDAFPGDVDVAALYADALMLQHPWDLWEMSGEPKPWTPEIREILEGLLAQTPNHPGANHYYIHVMEPSPFYKLALPSADRLGSLTPGLSHTVHMPSHIYLRAGQYDKGTVVNEKALDGYNEMIPLYAPVTGNVFLYEIHNRHMQTNNALLAGRYDYAKRSALKTRESVPAEYLDMEGPLASYIQYIYSTPLMVEVKFGKWDELLKAPPPGDAHVHSRVLYHFARGMAATGKKDLKKAREELAAMEKLMEDPRLAVPLAPFSSALESAKVGRQILIGSIALRRVDYDKAIEAFKEAVASRRKWFTTSPATGY